MKTRICPICGNTIFSTNDNFDVQHTCRLKDGTIMTTRTEWGKIPGRSNKRIDEDDSMNKGLNPYPHKRKWNDQKKALYDEVTVKTTVEM